MIRVGPSGLGQLSCRVASDCEAPVLHVFSSGRHCWQSFSVDTVAEEATMPPAALIPNTAGKSRQHNAWDQQLAEYD